MSEFSIVFTTVSKKSRMALFWITPIFYYPEKLSAPNFINSNEWIHRNNSFNNIIETILNNSILIENIHISKIDCS